MQQGQPDNLFGKSHNIGMSDVSLQDNDITAGTHHWRAGKLSTVNICFRARRAPAEMMSRHAARQNGTPCQPFRGISVTIWQKNPRGKVFVIG